MRLQSAEETGRHRLLFFQQRGGLIQHIVDVRRFGTRHHQVFMQHQAFRLRVQQVQDVVRRLRLAQRVFHIFRQRAGEQLQDLQVFVGFGGDHHR